MNFVHISSAEDVKILALDRGKVNAINEAVIGEFREALDTFRKDPGTRALILTGKEKFFSFGFDIPELLSYQQDDFMRFVAKFADLYTELFTYPKPVVAALGGHTVAGGCMLASACDRRLMVSGKAKISLNEITFGSSLFPGSVEMLKYWIGNRHAESVSLTGKMYSAEEALGMGLIDGIVAEEELRTAAIGEARRYAAHYGAAFEAIKKLLRSPCAETMRAVDERYRAEMVEIWYSPETWERLKNIKIH